MSRYYVIDTNDYCPECRWQAPEDSPCTACRGTSWRLVPLAEALAELAREQDEEKTEERKERG